MSNGQIENTKMPLESLITQRLSTAVGGSVGVTTAYQMVWLTGLRSKRGKSKFVCLSYVDSNIRVEMKRNLSVCPSYLDPTLGVKWNVVCPVRLDKKGRDLTQSYNKSPLPIYMSNGQIENTKTPPKSFIISLYSDCGPT